MKNRRKRVFLFDRFPMNALLILIVSILFMSLFQACIHDPVNPVNVINEEDVDIGEPCDPGVIYFESDILPLLRSNCAKSGCHDAVTHKDNIILDNYLNVMASGIVKPFDLNDSDIYEAITETDPDKIMPEPPNQALNADQVTLIADWIEQGAKLLSCDDQNLPCNAENISYSEFVAPLLTSKCIGCHSGGTPSGNIVLNSHSAAQTAALNGSLLGSITWTSGYEQMPKGSGQLSDCNIEKIKAWITNGAPNN